MQTKISFKSKKKAQPIRAAPWENSINQNTVKPIHDKYKLKLNNMAKKLYTAICFFPEEQNKRPHKYKNVSTPARLTLYMKRLGAEYINFYDADSKKYEFRLYANTEYEARRKEMKEKQRKMMHQTNKFTEFINNLKMTK